VGFNPADKRSGNPIAYRVKAKIAFVGNKGKVIGSLPVYAEHYSRRTIASAAVNAENGFNALIRKHSAPGFKPGHVIFFFHAEKQRTIFCCFFFFDF
jgi:hypothetical protein